MSIDDDFGLKKKREDYDENCEKEVAKLVEEEDGLNQWKLFNFISFLDPYTTVKIKLLD